MRKFIGALQVSNTMVSKWTSRDELFSFSRVNIQALIVALVSICVTSPKQREPNLFLQIL